MKNETTCTAMLATLDNDVKFLSYEYAQRRAAGFDDTVFICQRLGITYLRRRVRKQERLYCVMSYGIPLIWMITIPLDRYISHDQQVCGP